MNDTELLRAAAALLRKRADTEQVLRDRDPYYHVDHMPDGTPVTEASAWERTVTPDVGRKIADWLDSEASDLAEFSDTTKPLGYAARHIHHDFRPALKTARAVLEAGQERR